MILRAFVILAIISCAICVFQGIQSGQLNMARFWMAPSRMTYVRAKFDNQEYLVRNLPDKQEAAELLARINHNLILLSRHMIAKYIDDRDVNQLFCNFDRNALSEGSPDKGNTSYTYRKGKMLVLCIRHRDSGKFVNPNVITFVAIHELAHIMTEQYGHDDTFWSNFMFLLKEAMDIGIYERIDYRQYPQDYCGTKIKHPVL